MTRLILIRHGNTFEAGETPLQVGARTDLPLTAAGRMQAGSVARCLLREKIAPAAIFAGRLKRQTESAAILGLMLGAPVESGAEALTEIDYGPWEGLPSQEIAAKWPSAYEAWTKEGVWAEGIFNGNLETFQLRLKNWLAEIEGRYPEKTVAAVTSNGTLRFLSSLQSEVILPDPKVKTGHFCEAFLKKGSLSILRWNVNPS